jgi:sporulation protein YlmC with PRC-barrel domain
MVKLQSQRVAYALAILIALPLNASAQQAPTEPAPGAAPPEKVAPPRSGSGPDMAPPSPKAPAVKPAEAPVAPAPGTPVAQDLVGLNVFSSDGTRVGEVRAVNTGADGDIVALHIRTGGFLGFGGRIVAIPQGKFIRSGQSVRLDLDSEEVTGLPEVKN